MHPKQFYDSLILIFKMTFSFWSLRKEAHSKTILFLLFPDIIPVLLFPHF